jgi:hypothetical protein
MAGLKGSEMINIELNFGKEQISWQNIDSYEIEDSELRIVAYRFLKGGVNTKEHIEVILPKQYRLIVNQRE